MNYNNVTGEIVYDDNKINYTIVINAETLTANMTVQTYTKSNGTSTYRPPDIYVLINNTPLIIPNLLVDGVTSTNWTYNNSGSTTINYKKDGSLDLNLAFTYKTNGSYPNESFDENGYRISWIENTLSSVDMPVISSIQYKVNNTWKNVFAWVKKNGTWKRCLVWKKINGVWKRGN